MKRVIVILFLFLLNINFIFALGVSSPYWKNNPLMMEPGEVKEVSFTLVESEDVGTSYATVEMNDDQGIAVIISGDEYTAVSGTANAKIIIKVDIPQDANFGDTYDVKFSVRSIPEEEGTIQLGLKYEVNLPIEITKNGEGIASQIIPNEEFDFGLFVILVVVAIIILIIIVVLMLIYSTLRKKNYGY